MATVTGTFSASSNFKSSSATLRVVHKFNSGVNDLSDATKVRPTDWNAEHTIIGNTTQPNYKDYAVSNGSTVFIADTDVARVGAALVTFADGNNGGLIIQYFRSGTFNAIWGTVFGDGSFTAPRGTTFSAGTGFSFFLESNSAGARIAMKNGLSFSRTIRLWEWATPLNATGASGLR